MKTYTGVGSRKTPEDWLIAMTTVARKLAKASFTLRSGGAGGADEAFETGADDQKQIFIPWNGFNDLDDLQTGVVSGVCQAALDMAASYHPAWDRCSQGAKRLHARNCYQVLGANLCEPSDMLLCWTPKGMPVGGTATAIRIARDHGVPVYNFGSHADVATFKSVLEDL